MAARAQRAAHSAAPQARKFFRSRSKTGVFIEKNAIKLAKERRRPRRVLDLRSRRALVSSLLLCCCSALLLHWQLLARVPERLLPCFQQARRAWRCHMIIADMYALARKLCAFVLRVSAACRRAAAAYGSDCERILRCSHLHFVIKKAVLMAELAADMARFCVRHFGAFVSAVSPHATSVHHTPLSGLSRPPASP